MAKKNETKNAAAKAENSDENGSTTSEQPVVDDAVEATGAKKRGRPAAKANGTKTAAKPAKEKKPKKAATDDEDDDEMNSANGDAGDDDDAPKAKKGRGRPPKNGATKAKPKVSSGRPRGRPKKV